MLQLVDLSCEREGRTLFSGLSAEIEAGEIVQITGPNGAGKTSLLRLLTGISSNFTGEIRYKSENIQRSSLQFRQDLLYLGHSPGIKRSLTPEENLNWYLKQLVQSYQVSTTIEEALSIVGLQGYEDSPCFALSAGQLRRVALARLFLSNSPIWLLDEPFTAIDVDGVSALEARFQQHAESGGVIILTTHQKLSLTSVKYLNLLDFVLEGDLHEYE